jgi:hypothetical protein
VGPPPAGPTNPAMLVPRGEIVVLRNVASAPEVYLQIANQQSAIANQQFQCSQWRAERDGT